MQPDGQAVLTYAIQIQNETVGKSYEAFVDAHDNTLVSLTDFVAKSSVGSAKKSSAPLILTASPFFGFNF